MRWFKIYHLVLFDFAERRASHIIFIFFKHEPYPCKNSFEPYFSKLNRDKKTLFPTANILPNIECGFKWVLLASVSFLIYSIHRRNVPKMRKKTMYSLQQKPHYVHVSFIVYSINGKKTKNDKEYEQIIKHDQWNCLC